MLKFGAIIFDFDGVLLESEFEGNRQLAELLTDFGHRTQRRGDVQALRRAQRPAVHRRDRDADRRVRFRQNSTSAQQGQARPRAARGHRCGRRRGRFRPSRCRRSCPKAVASSSSTRWIRTPSGASRPRRAVRRSRLQRPRACRARQAGAGHLSPCGRAARRSRSTDCVILEDSRGRRDRRARVGRAGDRPRRGARIASTGMPTRCARSASRRSRTASTRCGGCSA